MEQQKHRTLVLWALEYAEELLVRFEQQYSNELRPRNAVETGRDWAQGVVKMQVAKKAIHAVHNAASEIADDLVYCSIARAIGQAVSTIHVESHAIGGPIYALSALVHQTAPDIADAKVAEECDRLLERLRYWETHVDVEPRQWASFLLRDDIPNKELQLREKREQGREQESTQTD